MKNTFKNDEDFHPHSPDVKERETLDNGFSKGWGMHHKPSEKYWVDAHCHIQFKDESKMSDYMKIYLKKLHFERVKRFVACSPIMMGNFLPSEGKDYGIKCLKNLEELMPYLALAKETGDHAILMYMWHQNPDVELVRQAIKSGIAGIKLHNAFLISDAIAPDIWLSEAWEPVFKLVEQHRMPILWHVTQRLSAAPYGRVGANAYWRDGWKKGTHFTNEDLLQVFLKLVERYPGINFIGAHQLHMGWERLGELLDRYENLYTDTSVGCILRRDDTLYNADREYLRDFFIRYSHKLMHGTDIFITDGYRSDLYLLEDMIDDMERTHIRFIQALDLPDGVLQRVSHGNAERLFGLPSKEYYLHVY